MVTIRFEDPPERPGAASAPDPSELVKNQDRDRIVQALPGYPGRWAVVSVHRSRPAAARIARLLRARYPQTEFRTVGGSGGTVYGRYPSRDPSP